jgi:transaldolase
MRKAVEALPGLGIDLTATADRLEQEGVALFVKAFDNLLQHLEAKAAKLAA